MPGILLVHFLAAPALSDSQATHLIDNFEGGVDWEGATESTRTRRSGRAAAAWVDHPKNPVLRAPEDKAPKDWSGYDRLSFWMYSETANDAGLTLVLESENKEDALGWDYYFYHFRVDWTGWKRFSLHLGEGIRPTRHPRGWDQIDGFYIATSGWGHEPLPDTALYIDDVALERDLVSMKLDSPRVRESDDAIRKSWRVTVTNRTDEPRGFRLALDQSRLRAFSASLTRPETKDLAPEETDSALLTLRAPRSASGKVPPLTRESCVISIEDPPAGAAPPRVTVDAATPLPVADHPCLLATQQELDAAKNRAERYEWAKPIHEKIIAAADAALAEPVDVPQTGGQWTHYYSCPKHGRGLKAESPTRHVCPVDGEVFSGWPYDEVYVSIIHHGYTRKLQNLGLAYAWTDNEPYAQHARAILLDYAAKYPQYEIHDSRGNPGRSGGKRFAQTLDEAVDLIRVAWAYDLIYSSPRLTDDDRKQIEERFLRPSCDVIMRNNAGISNWQTWHNAGVAAVAFCLRDTRLADWAINGSSGFRFQMQNSILPDGFWYEGAAAYHFYSVRALVHTAEAAIRAGVDLYADERFRSLFDAPLSYVYPDLRFPAVNDSDNFALAGQEGNYAVAYARWKGPAYLAVAALGGRNSLEALLLGPDEVGDVPSLDLASRDFPGLGAAVLRQGAGDDAVYVHLDYGPHGGGHGHPDKLALILYGLGRELAPDPGRLAYSVPLHGSWYRQTVAHNTIVVDQKSHRATQGKLDLFGVGPDVQAMSASTDGAYKGVLLSRTVVLKAGYFLDITAAESEEEHTYDWVWHNRGEAAMTVPLTPLDAPIHDAAGYQHIEDVRRGNTDGSWSATWSLDEGTQARLTMAAAPGTTVFLGRGPGQPPSEAIPLIMARRSGGSTIFVALFELGSMASVAPELRVAQHEKRLTVEVSRDGETETFTVDRSGEEVSIECSRPDGRTVALKGRVGTIPH